MAMVEIPRRVLDPKWPVVPWPYKSYPWRDPTYQKDANRPGINPRIPDYMPLIDPLPPVGQWVWLPSYKELPTMEQMSPFPYRHFVWYLNGKEEELKTSGYDVIPQEYHSELQLVRRFDQDFVFHPLGKYFRRTWWIPNYDNYANYMFYKERKNFNIWGPKDFSHLVKPYQVLFDSRVQHPTSGFWYSAVRVNPHTSMRFRRKFYCKNWDKIVIPMSFMLERASREKHQIIIVEPTPLANLMFRRIMYGWNLMSVCMWMCIITIAVSHYRIRWPCVYLLPCLIGAYARHAYKWEYRQDPAKKYTFWTTWVNDLIEHEVFKHIDVYPDLLRQERMTFMQLEDLTFRQKLNGYFTAASILVAARTLFNRIKYKDVGETMAWQVLTSNICEKTASTVRYAHNLMHPFNDRCTFDDEMMAPTRFLYWAGILCMYIFFAPPLIIRIKKRFDWRTRSRLAINQVSWRAFKGERRYIRMLQPLYWIYRWSFPRDGLGVRDKWYLNQRFRNTPGSHQFYF